MAAQRHPPQVREKVFSLVINCPFVIIIAAFRDHIGFSTSQDAVTDLSYLKSPHPPNLKPWQPSFSEADFSTLGIRIHRFFAQKHLLAKIVP